MSKLYKKISIYTLLNNLPNDADFITWDPRFLDGNEYNNCISLINKNINYNFIELNNDYKNLIGGMMYGLMNRETMKLYLDNQRNFMNMSDHIEGIYEYPIVKRYICSKCICTDHININKKFNEECLPYKNIYNDINKLNIDNFFIPEKFSLFTR